MLVAVCELDCAPEREPDAVPVRELDLVPVCEADLVPDRELDGVPEAAPVAAVDGVPLLLPNDCCGDGEPPLVDAPVPPSGTVVDADDVVADADGEMLGEPVVSATRRARLGAAGATGPRAASRRNAVSTGQAPAPPARAVSLPDCGAPASPLMVLTSFESLAPRSERRPRNGPTTGAARPYTRIATTRVVIRVAVMASKGLSSVESSGLR